MPPKRKVKFVKMDARKSREPVSNHPTPTPPTGAETAATRAMNEALDEALLSSPLSPPSSPPIEEEIDWKPEYETLTSQVGEIRTRMLEDVQDSFKEVREELHKKTGKIWGKFKETEAERDDLARRLRVQEE